MQFQVKEFLESQGLPIRALLLLDNAPSHPPVEELNNIDECITVMYMPPNVTPLIQPMDQNVIRLVKLYYRKKLLSDVVTKNDIGTALKAVTLRDALINLNLAWEKLNPTVVRKCWHNILPETNDYDDEEENIPLSVLKLRLNDEDPEYAQSEVMNILNLINSEVKKLNTYLLAQVLKINLQVYDQHDVQVWNEDRQLENEKDEVTTEFENEDSVGDDDETVTDKLISTDEALKSLNTVIQWAEENPNEIEYSRVIALQDLRTKLIQKMYNKPTKQTKVTDFFQSTD